MADWRRSWKRAGGLRDPLWSAKLLLEKPDMIRQLHYDYFVAGADVATTASYQATFAGFARRGLSPRQAEDLLILSVRLAQQRRRILEQCEQSRRSAAPARRRVHRLLRSVPARRFRVPRRLCLDRSPLDRFSSCGLDVLARAAQMCSPVRRFRVVSRPKRS